MDPFNFWLSESGVSRTAIGLLSLIVLTYSLKAIWTPFIDRLTIPFFSETIGARKSWLLISQLTVTFTLFGLAT